jgi:hypothetical protein
MADRELFRAVFVRHGHTDNTDIPPDITLTGQAALFRSSLPIQEFAAPLPIRVCTSPKVRAIGSGQYLNQFLHGEDGGEEPALSAVNLRRPDEAQRIFAYYRSLTDPLAIEKAYWTRAEFDNPEIFEPRALVKARLFRFLNVLINQHNRLADPRCYVLVSHVELLCHLVARLFSLDFSVDDPVNCAEPIFIIAHACPESLQLTIDFRDQRRCTPYDVQNPHRPY